MVYEALSQEAVFLALACILIFGVYAVGCILLIIGLRAHSRSRTRRRRRFL